jgi:hypothetical protein
LFRSLNAALDGGFLALARRPGAVEIAAMLVIREERRQ